MFHGLSAFPLTPLKEGKFDERAFAQLLAPPINAGVDSLGILGSTGSYAYLTPAERAAITSAFATFFLPVHAELY